MTTIELFWFLLKNLAKHPKCATKTVTILDGQKSVYLNDIEGAIFLKNVDNASELGCDELCEGDEDYCANHIVLYRDGNN